MYKKFFTFLQAEVHLIKKMTSHRSICARATRMAYRATPQSTLVTYSFFAGTAVHGKLVIVRYTPTTKYDIILKHEA